MGNSLRQGDTTAVNFFFLLDIFTCCTGILVFIAMILATSANFKVTALEPPDAQPALKQTLGTLVQKRDQLNQENKQLQEMVTQAEATPSLTSLDGEIKQLIEHLAKRKLEQERIRTEITTIAKDQSHRDEKLGLADLRHNIQQLEEEITKIEAQKAATEKQREQWKTQIEIAENELSALMEQKNKLFLIPEQSRTGKEPLLATVSEKLAILERLNKPESKKVISNPKSRSNFMAALRDFPPKSYYIVFYVKPSGVSVFKALKTEAENANYQVGYDVLEEEKEITTTPGK